MGSFNPWLQRTWFPGDLVLLEAGNVVPADLRLTDVTGLRMDESALTGESQPVDKLVEPLAGEDLPLGDRLNMAYKGTSVTRGRGQGLVVGTAMATELGRIAALLTHGAVVKTPLKQRLTRFRATAGTGRTGDLRRPIPARARPGPATSVDVPYRGNTGGGCHSGGTARRDHDCPRAGRRVSLASAMRWCAAYPPWKPWVP